MSFDPRDYDGVTFADEHRIEPDEASVLRLSIIERLDRQHADTVGAMDRAYGDDPQTAAFWALDAREQALWSALEIVRDIQGVPAWQR